MASTASSPRSPSSHAAVARVVGSDVESCVMRSLTGLDVCCAPLSYGTTGASVSRPATAQAAARMMATAPAAGCPASAGPGWDWGLDSDAGVDGDAGAD